MLPFINQRMDINGLDFSNDKQKGASFIELLAYILIISLLMISASQVNQSFVHKSRLFILTSEVENLIKATIHGSRVNQCSGQIILTESKSSTSSLIFIINNKELWRLPLPNSLVISSELKSSSVFNNHIEILPNGYASPSSISLNFKGISLSSKPFALFSISRLGNVKLRQSS